MLYSKVIRNTLETLEAQGIIDKAMDYDRECLKSLGKDEVILPVAEGGNAVVSIIFTGDSSEFERVKAMRPKLRSSGMALINDRIYVSLPHFHRKWDNDAWFRETVSWKLKKLGKLTSDEIMKEYVAICLADLIMEIYQSL